MDDEHALREQFKQLTVSYEKAIHTTYVSFAAVGPKASVEALETWKAALTKEENIRVERNAVLKKLHP